ncbi:cGMP-dependent protein kinase, isozyme 2 forms cD4/T1/T3A/T3B [Eufriesea mexicana]|nr:cGMP-dependent protein kinase, isozyme 2 forms cD4/T1/T3A/T3B [Eufriesea mexicana]
MDSIRDLKRLLYERTEALRRRDEVIEMLENALEEKDITIRYLQNEIDKFRQIVDFSLASGGIGPGQRAKRQAISAEPLSKDTRVIVKFQKPQRSRELIKAAILDNDFMKNLELTQIREIVDCMYPVTFSAGSTIIREGDVGSIVYVMEEDRSYRGYWRNLIAEKENVKDYANGSNCGVEERKKNRIRNAQILWNQGKARDAIPTKIAPLLLPVFPLHDKHP